MEWLQQNQEKRSQHFPSFEHLRVPCREVDLCLHLWGVETTASVFLQRIFCCLNDIPLPPLLLRLTPPISLHHGVCSLLSPSLYLDTRILFYTGETKQRNTVFFLGMFFPLI